MDDKKRKKELIKALRDVEKGNYSHVMKVKGGRIGDGKSGIYFFIKKINGVEELVYIGKTVNFWGRYCRYIMDSKKQNAVDIFTTDYIYFIECNKDIIDELEHILISMFQPKKNKRRKDWVWHRLKCLTRVDPVCYKERKASFDYKNAKKLVWYDDERLAKEFFKRSKI
jgi:hypothetical protein